jgi:hypothetical protein
MALANVLAHNPLPVDPNQNRVAQPINNQITTQSGERE